MEPKLTFQAFIAFINLHVLFSNRGEKAQPAAKAAGLEMATDKQHKLGGAFQAAVERYASDIEEDSNEDQGQEMSLAATQREVVFLQLVSVFVGAIRCGVLDVEQAREPLAHYGRFELTYDIVVKKLVDVLRDEGIYNRDATTVQHVIGQALQNSFTMFLEKDEKDESDAPVALARLAASAFVVHGTHFTVLKQIHPDDVYDLHVGAIDWLFKQVRVLVKQQLAKDNATAKQQVAKKRGQLFHFFRPLALLLGPITGRDALRIRSHLEKTIDDSGVAETQARNSSAYKAYEKRLVAVAGKDSELKVAARKSPPAKASKAAKSAEVIEDSDGEDAQEEQAHDEGAQEEDAQEEDAEVDEIQDPDDEEDGDRTVVLENGAEANGDDADDIEEENGHTEAEEIESAAADSDEPMTNADDDEPVAVTNGNKRTLPEDDDDELPDVNLGSQVDMDVEIDLAFNSSPGRERSESLEPNAKRRKTVTKY